MSRLQVRPAVVRGRPGSGAISAGSVATAEAGVGILRAGGNAVDAVLAATMAACVAEQAVASLGGGGFLILRMPSGAVMLRDFFVDTPGRGLSLDRLEPHFLPMAVKFPGTSQVFHLGMGSVAVPGLLEGLLSAHREFGHLPLPAIVAPARRYAARGVPMEPAQAVITNMTRELVGLSPESRALIWDGERYLRSGDLIFNSDFARFLDLVASGEVAGLTSEPFAKPLLAAMAKGGLVTATDLAQYQVYPRVPVQVNRAGNLVYSTAPPSFGGSIITSALDAAPKLSPGDPSTWVGLLRALDRATDYQRSTPGRPPVSWLGTTHVSAVDARGMVASLTSSNGVTSGFVIPGTGIQLNNMLGEADLNPAGFHATPPGVRMGSMMSPSILVRPSGCVVGLGTGGSERIRSALTEVMARMIDLEEPLDVAIGAGRIHSSDEGLQVEPLFEPETLEALAGAGLGPVNVWAEPDVYFGGVNAVEMFADGSVLAVADGRRGGCALIA